jgi:hypothetical protein
MQTVIQAKLSKLLVNQPDDAKTTGSSFEKDKIVLKALVVPMTPIDEVVNEDTDRDMIEVKAQGPPKIVNINCEQIE